MPRRDAAAAVRVSGGGEGAAGRLLEAWLRLCQELAEAARLGDEQAISGVLQQREEVLRQLGTAQAEAKAGGVSPQLAALAQKVQREGRAAEQAAVVALRRRMVELVQQAAQARRLAECSQRYAGASGAWRLGTGGG